MNRPEFRTLGLAGLALGAAPAICMAQPTVAKPAPAEVVVTAEKSQTVSKIDRTVYSVAANLQASTGAAAEVLNAIPSVSVDVDGNVSLRGDSNVTILVDGKPSAQFSGPTRGLSILQFPAQDIDKVEVLTNPSAQYKAEGSAGVINIVTKKSGKAGLTGSGQFMLGDQRRYVGSLDGAYNVGRLGLSAGVALRQDVKRRLTDDARLTTDPVLGAAASSHQINEQFRRLTPSGHVGLTYALTSTQSLAASMTHRELSGGRYFDQHDQSGPPGGAPSSISDRHSDGYEWSVDSGENLRFEQKLGRPDETLSIGLQHSLTSERERYAYRNAFTLPVAPLSFDHLHLSLDLVKLEFSLDYDLPLGGDRGFKAGYDLEDDRNAFDEAADTVDPLSGTLLPNANQNSHFRYHQQIHAAYAQYQAPLGAWRLQAGLRAEAADVATYQITGNIAGGHRELGLYPSLHVERDIGSSGRLSLGMARRITRPNPEALNPFIDRQDTQNLRAGNADLKPKDTWAYELGYGFNTRPLSYSLNGYVRFERNATIDILRPLGADVVLATKANLPQSRSGGVEFSLSGKRGPLGYAVSGDAFYAQIDAAAVGGAGLKSTTGVNLKTSLDWRPTSADTFQISATRTDKRLTPQGYEIAVNQVNIGYRRQITPDLALMATVTDLLDGQRTVRQVSTPQLQDTYQRHQLGRVALIGLTYAFGARKAARTNGFQYDQ